MTNLKEGFHTLAHSATPNATSYVTNENIFIYGHLLHIIGKPSI